MSEEIIRRDREPQLLILVGSFDNAALEALKRIFPAIREINTTAEVRPEEWETLITSASKVAEAARREWGTRGPVTFLFQDGGVTPFNNPAL